MKMRLSLSGSSRLPARPLRSVLACSASACDPSIHDEDLPGNERACSDTRKYMAFATSAAEDHQPGDRIRFGKHDYIPDIIELQQHILARGRMDFSPLT